MGLLKCDHYQLVDDTEENHCVCNSIKSSSSSLIDVIILRTIFFTPGFSTVNRGRSCSICAINTVNIRSKLPAVFAVHCE